MRNLRPGRRESLFAFLYFCEGAPIGFIWWALPAYWASLGVPVEHITMIVAVTVLPWTFKWLWAPLVDWTAPNVGYETWIVAAQVVMGFALLPLVWLDPIDQFPRLLLSLVLHALAAATQDVAIDGLCVATVERHERGAINGWMQTGMLLGRALFGGGAVLIMAAGTVTAGVTLLVALLWTSACGLALWSRRGQYGASITAVQRPPWRQSLRWIVGRAETWLALAFALLAGSSFETVGALLGPYLSNLELRLTQVGLFQIGPLAGAMALGALFGGRISDRFGHARSVVRTAGDYSAQPRPGGGRVSHGLARRHPTVANCGDLPGHRSVYRLVLRAVHGSGTWAVAGDGVQRVDGRDECLRSSLGVGSRLVGRLPWLRGDIHYYDDTVACRAGHCAQPATARLNGATERRD